jgi:4-carboxymuconolactone decarboxylase
LTTDRFPPIAPEAMTTEQREAADELAAGPRGGLRGPFIPLLRSPELLRRLQKTGEYLRYDCALGRKLTELTILLTAHEWRQSYEWKAHRPLALEAGIAQETIAAIESGTRPEGMTTDEEAVYDFCIELHRNHRVSDQTFHRALAQFGEQGVIDMTALCGYYSTLAMILNVAQTPA